MSPRLVAVQTRVLPRKAYRVFVEESGIAPVPYDPMTHGRGLLLHPGVR